MAAEPCHTVQNMCAPMVEEKDRLSWRDRKQILLEFLRAEFRASQWDGIKLLACSDVHPEIILPPQFHFRRTHPHRPVMLVTYQQMRQNFLHLQSGSLTEFTQCLGIGKRATAASAQMIFCEQGPLAAGQTAHQFAHGRIRTNLKVAHGHEATRIRREVQNRIGFRVDLSPTAG